MYFNTVIYDRYFHIGINYSYLNIGIYDTFSSRYMHIGMLTKAFITDIFT